jgi:opacity protein-like surface antigen
LHSATLGNFSHCFWQSLQIIATTFAKWPVCSELTAAIACTASQAATSW